MPLGLYKCKGRMNLIEDVCHRSKTPHYHGYTWTCFKRRSTSGKHSRSRRAVELTVKVRIEYPSVHTVYGDGRYDGAALKGNLGKPDIRTIEVVPRKKETGFVPVSQRWDVERTLACISSFLRFFSENCETAQS